MKKEVKTRLFIVVLTAVLSINFGCKSKPSPSKVLTGYVPNEETAIKIAEAIWLPIYGEEIYDEKPYTAVLKDSIWTVAGTFHGSGKGGVAYIKIQRSDCKIVGLGHGK